MITQIPIGDISQQLIRQLSSVFIISKVEEELIHNYFDEVLIRCENCFSRNSNKYYWLDGKTFFSPFQSAQYTIFLYYFSNTIFRKSHNRLLADKLYYLNKMMNACDIYYEVELPSFFRLDHPVGSVIGRATYGDGFCFGQNCTVGNNKGKYPIIGKNVRMCANSLILGNSRIGNNVTIGANTCVKDQNIPDNSIVFGNSPNIIIKSKNTI